MSDLQAQPDLTQPVAPPAIGVRALVMGVGLAGFLSWLSIYSNSLLKGTTLSDDHNAVGATAFLFLLVVCGNTLARFFERRFRGRALLVGAFAGVVGLGAIVVLFSLAARMPDGGAKQTAQIVLCLAGLAWGSFTLIAVTRVIEWPFRPGAYLALGQAEMLTSFAMMLLATAIATTGLCMLLPQVITAHTYYASPENRWSVLIEPYVPSWLALKDTSAVTAFYEGLDLPRNASFRIVMEAIPWKAWLPLLGYWMVLMMSVYFTSVCMMVILRRQWMDKEILIYPLTRVPIEMTTENPQPGQLQSLLTPLMKNKLMWLGFGVAFAFFSLRGLSAYAPELVGTIGGHRGLWKNPQWWIIVTFCLFAGMVVSVIADARKTPLIGLLLIFHLACYKLLDNTIDIFIAPSFAVLAFIFLINLDLSFSLWWFAILVMMFKGLLIKLGIRWTEFLTGYGVEGGVPRLYHGEFGALLVFVLYGLWVGRRQLADVARKALFNAKDVDDSDEVMSYRFAFFGMICGLVVAATWMVKSGLSVSVAVFFLTIALLIFVALSRVVAEGGLACCVSPAIAPEITVSTLGAGAIGPAGLAAMSFTYIWTADIRVFVMAEAATGLKLVQGVRTGRRRVFMALMMAIVTSLLVSMGTVMYLSYRYGGLNLEDWWYRGGPMRPFNFFSRKIDYIDRVNRTNDELAGLRGEFEEETDPNRKLRSKKRIEQKDSQLSKEMREIVPYKKGWAATGIGAAVMAGLIFLRNAVVGWPLHPIGLPMAGTWLVDRLWLPIFLAWLVKEVMLRYGGPKLYTRSVPFFLGLILGQFTCGLVWLVIDYFTGMTSNELFPF